VSHRPFRVELAGYLGTAVGAGEGARRYLAALQAAGVAVRARDIELSGRDSAMTEFRGEARLGLRGARFNLLCLNPEQLLPYIDSRAAPRTSRRTNIAAWSWEVDVLPLAWAGASRRVSEIWACSEFTARFIRAGTGARVIAMHHPRLAARANAGAPPAELPAGFRVLVMFDYLSTIERKNPIGAIEAYRRAFAAGDGAQLIVKSLNGVHRPEQRSKVERAAAGRRDILLTDGTISGAARDSLLAACDCLLSLHRSEGFGLSLADAMAAGKPVVATAYGGNTEFMRESSSYLIPYELTQVGAGCEHYPPEASWAEPDVGRAAAALRAMFDDQEAARRRGQAGQSDVEALLAPQLIGQRMLERFTLLADAASS
jgi:glycosyltransferase involved in cell wall biosynthesis